MHEEFINFIRYYLGPTTEYFSCLGFIIYALAMCRIMTSVLTLATQSLFSRNLGWMSRLTYLGEWAGWLFVFLICDLITVLPIIFSILKLVIDSL